MQNLLGKEVVQKINERIAEKRKKLEEKNIVPSLCVLMFNASNDDIAYKNSIVKKCEKNNICCNVVETLEESEFLKNFQSCNKKEDVDGIIVMGKLTNTLAEVVKKDIEERKDIDGMGYMTMAKLYSGEKTILPCTAEAVLQMLDYYNIDLKGKNVTVIGRSTIIGKPLFMSILARGATVTVCHSKTKDLKDALKKADIVCSAVGKINLVTKNMIKKDMIVVDIGINVDEHGKMCGDVDYANVSKKVKAITPVPGGVGVITNSVLIEHVLDSAIKR